jgi:hypothetical protein
MIAKRVNKSDVNRCRALHPQWHNAGFTHGVWHGVERFYAIAHRSLETIKVRLLDRRGGIAKGYRLQVAPV